MVFFNHATRQMTTKIVYYGPGLCGKTTNLNAIYAKTSNKARGEMVSLNTETDRTLFFDLLPMDVGVVGGFKTKLQLYTVPGQVFYNSTRKLVLKGVDGIVFVVDSQVPMLDASKESFQNLQENLRELGLDINQIPMVFQWNKRDLKNVIPVQDLEAELNPLGLPSFQAIAQDGSGVFETLRGITKLALGHIKTHVLGEGAAKATPAPPPPPPPPPPTPPPSGALEMSDLASITQMLDGDTSITGMTAPPELDEAPPAKPAPAPLPAAAATIRMALQESGPIPVPPAAMATVQMPVQVPPPSPTEHIQTKPVSLPDVREAMAAKAAAAQATRALEMPKTAPVLPKFAMAMPTPGVPKATPRSPNPKDAISTLLGELTLVGKMGLPSTLRLDLPDSVDGQELEVVVQVRAKGQVVAETSLKRPSPSKGIMAKLTVELKRS